MGGEEVLLDIKNLCDTLSGDIEKQLNSKADSRITDKIAELRNMLNSYLNGLA